MQEPNNDMHTLAIWSNLPNSSFSMCTSSPGEQSLASRVNPTISAYSILSQEKHVLLQNTSSWFHMFSISNLTSNSHAEPQYLGYVIKIVNTNKLYTPDIGVSLDVEVVKIVCVLNLAKIWTLKSLDDLGFHHPGNVSWQQWQQQTLLMEHGENKPETRRFFISSAEGSSRPHLDADVPAIVNLVNCILKKTNLNLFLI